MNEKLTVIKRISISVKDIETEIQRRKCRVDRIYRFIQQFNGNPGQKEWADAYNEIVNIHLRRMIDLNERLLSLEAMANRILECG